MQHTLVKYMNHPAIKKLRDLTPVKFLCGPLASSCPAVLKSNMNSYVIIGKIADSESPELRGRVGQDEMAVEISSELLETAIELMLKQRKND